MKPAQAVESLRLFAGALAICIVSFGQTTQTTEQSRLAEEASEKLFQEIGVTYLKAPFGYDDWFLTRTCQQALDLYRQSSKLEKGAAISIPEGSSQYSDWQKATVVEIKDCAEVRFDDSIDTGFITPELLAISAEQLKTAQDKSRKLAIQRAAAIKTQAAKQAAAIKAQAAKQAVINRLPILDSGLTSVFIAADRKCSEQFVQALSMDGLEKRKKLADLITYSCGFLESPRVHAVRTDMQGEFCSVNIVAGKRANESGWVPCSWLKVPQE